MKFFQCLERLERQDLRVFWLVTSLFAFVISLNSSLLNDRYYMESRLTESCIEKAVAGQTALRICGGDFVPGLGIRKKFDPVLYTRLEQKFSDWEARMNYQILKKYEFHTENLQIPMIRLIDFDFSEKF